MRDRALYLVKALARRVVFAPADLLHRLRGGGELVPPRGLSFVGGGDFTATGREFLGHFTELGGLEPNDRVLDIGCGIGRMAIPLSEYLEGGSYAGFDVGRAMIRWCRRNISPRHPEFEFEWAPIHNAKYNPFGNLSAAEYRFPYPDSSFDFAFATSLFTHLVHDEVSHYLAETARVLKPGGTCLLTFFLLTSESEAEIASGTADLAFTHPIAGGATTDAGLPEEAVAFDLEEVTLMLGEVGLAVREPIHRGQWANAPDAPSYQDIIVAKAR